jgi:hypothetical protein
MTPEERSRLNRMVMMVFVVLRMLCTCSPLFVAVDDDTSKHMPTVWSWVFLLPRGSYFSDSPLRVRLSLTVNHHGTRSLPTPDTDETLQEQ